MITTDDLHRDLSPFSDPATELKIDSGSHGVRIQMVRNGAEHDYFLNFTDSSVTARHIKGRKFASLKSLLASAEFADIRSFSATQLRLYKNFASDELIPVEGDIDSERLTSNLLSTRLATPLLVNHNTRRIDVVLIDGPAGVGKTSLIQKILVQRARRHLDANALPPLLHVASRGRRLTGLDDALAQSLQIVRAKFTFDQTPVLVRHNLIQIAIDGFDELVDPEGYKDAWFALRDFFEAIEFGGPIILAGRDTFFDQQSFIRHLEDSLRPFTLSHVRLSPVSPSRAKEWLKKRGWSDKDLKDPYTNIVFRAGSYALRPFFLSELAKARSWAAIESRDLTPRAFLVKNFIDREARLLSEQISIPSAQITKKLNDLFEEIALEMADNEHDSVDLGFLQLVTEMAFGELLEPRDLAKLQHKAGSFALLETDAREGHRRFPHTEISHHFLASALIRLVSSGAQVRFMRRGTVSSDFLSIFGEIFFDQPESVGSRFIGNLEKVLNEEQTFDRLPENAASLLISALCKEIDGVRSYSDIQIGDAVLFGLVAPANLERLRFQRLDVREAQLSQVTFSECEVVNLTVDDTTRFGSTLPNVHQLLVLTDKGNIEEVFDPDKVGRWINEHSIREAMRPQNQEAVKLLDRVCKVMLRQHMIKAHHTDEAGKLLENPYWEAIEEILTKAKFVDRIEGKATAGAAASFVRMREPFRLLVQSEDDVKAVAVWDKVASLPVR